MVYSFFCQTKSINCNYAKIKFIMLKSHNQGVHSFRTLKFMSSFQIYAHSDDMCQSYFYIITHVTWSHYLCNRRIFWPPDAYFMTPAQSTAYVDTGVNMTVRQCIVVKVLTCGYAAIGLTTNYSVYTTSAYTVVLNGPVSKVGSYLYLRQVRQLCLKFTY